MPADVLGDAIVVSLDAFGFALGTHASGKRIQRETRLAINSTTVSKEVSCSPTLVDCRRILPKLTLRIPPTPGGDGKLFGIGSQGRSAAFSKVRLICSCQSAIAVVAWIRPFLLKAHQSLVRWAFGVDELRMTRKAGVS